MASVDAYPRLLITSSDLICIRGTHINFVVYSNPAIGHTSLSIRSEFDEVPGLESVSCGRVVQIADRPSVGTVTSGSTKISHT